MSGRRREQRGKALGGFSTMPDGERKLGVFLARAGSGVVDGDRQRRRHRTLGHRAGGEVQAPSSPELRLRRRTPTTSTRGPLYSLTQAVKGNEQVRGRCSSLLRAPARREAARPCRRSRTRRPRSAGADQLPEQQEAALPRQGLRPPLQHGAPRRRPPLPASRLSRAGLNAAAWRCRC